MPSKKKGGKKGKNGTKKGAARGDNSGGGGGTQAGGDEHTLGGDDESSHMDDEYMDGSTVYLMCPPCGQFTLDAKHAPDMGLLYEEAALEMQTHFDPQSKCCAIIVVGTSEKGGTTQHVGIADHGLIDWTVCVQIDHSTLATPPTASPPHRLLSGSSNRYECGIMDCRMLKQRR